MIEDITPTTPLGTDAISNGDDQIRQLKTDITDQFPNLGAIAVSRTAAEINDLATKNGGDTITGTFTGDVTGNVTGNAGTVTTNADMTGDVTSSGSNETTLAPAITPWIQIGATQVASSSTSIDFEDIDDTYNEYMIVIAGAILSNNGDNMYLYLGDGASPTTTWRTSLYHYHVDNSGGASSSYAGSSSTSDTKIMMCPSMTDNENGRLNARIRFEAPNVSAQHQISWDGYYATSGGTPTKTNGVGEYAGATVLSGVRIRPSANTIASGVFKLYGR